MIPKGVADLRRLNHRLAAIMTQPPARHQADQLPNHRPRGFKVDPVCRLRYTVWANRPATTNAMDRILGRGALKNRRDTSSAKATA